MEGQSAAVEADTEALTQQLQHATTATKTLDQDVADLQHHNSAAAQRVQSLKHRQLEVLCQATASHSGCQRVATEIKRVRLAIRDRLTELKDTEDQIEGVKADLEAAATKKAALAEELHGLEDGYTQAASQVKAAEKGIASELAAIAAATLKLEVGNRKLQTIMKDKQPEDTGPLETEVATLEKGVVAKQAAIAAQQEMVESKQQQLEGMQERIAALNSDIAKLEWEHGLIVRRKNRFNKQCVTKGAHA